MPLRSARALCPAVVRLAWMAALAGHGLLALANGDTARDIEQRHRRGDAAAAWQPLDQALAQRPGSASLRFLRAVLLAEAGRTAEAAAQYERLTQDFPELPEPHNNLAVQRAAAVQLGARGLPETALQLAPAYRTARENVGDVHVLLALRAYQAAATGAGAQPSLQAKLRLAHQVASLQLQQPASR